MDNIIIDNVSKAYDGKQVLQCISAEIDAGNTTAIMAPSGRGKTTLLNILMGLEKADSGSITGIDGLRKSAVFQEDRLCENLNAIANIKLVDPSLDEEDISNALQSMKLCGCENQPVSELSGGMRRRVAILRALLASWDILFLDEPFKGLDSKTKEQVTEEVRKRCEGRTVLLVTHIQDEAKMLNCKKIIQL